MTMRSMQNQHNVDKTKKENQEENHEKTTRDEFEKDLEELENKNKEYLEGWKRAKADYLNLKKESEKQYQDLRKFANAGLIMEILPVFDNFKLAAVHIPEEQKKSDWVIGIMHIKKQLGDLLKNLGVEEIKTVGEKFNPELHEAVPAGTRGFDADNDADLTQIKGEEREDGVIVKEARPGHMLHGKVIQPARVIVGQQTD